jgi:hypothetical protein
MKAEPAATGGARPGTTAKTSATTTPLAVPSAAKAEPAKAEAKPINEPVEPAPEVLWAVDFPDGQDRELTAAQVRKELAAGVLNETTLVWREGMEEWKELGQVPELAAPAPKPAAKIPEPAPQRAKAPSAPLLDPGPQRPRAASAPELADSPMRAQAASSPAFTEPAAQRPRAPSAPVIPEPAAQRPRAPSAPVIPEPAPPAAAQFAPVAPTPAPAPIPKNAPVFSPFDTPFEAPKPLTPSFSPAAPLTGLAPAFPAPSAAKAPGAAPSTAQPFAVQAFPNAAVPIQSGGDDWPKPKSRAPLIIGIVVAVVLIGGAIFYFLSSSKDAPPAPAPVSALPAVTPPSTHPSPDSTATAEPSAAPDTAEAAPSPARRDALAPPPSGPAATPNAGFAELFASGARSADEKHGVSGPAQRFDANLAKAALTTAATQVGACREKGGPAGKATVVVTFEPSGKVSSATVSDAPFAGTSSGACIATVMKRATVPAFSGLPGTVSKTLSIQ